jgi:hypothetical protein
VCEGAAQEENATGKVACLTGGGKQKAKKSGVLEAGAKGKEVLKEGHLKAYGVAATLKTEETITFAEALTLFAYGGSPSRLVLGVAPSLAVRPR